MLCCGQYHDFLVPADGLADDQGQRLFQVSCEQLIDIIDEHGQEQLYYIIGVDLITRQGKLLSRGAEMWVESSRMVSTEESISWPRHEVCH